MRTSVFLLSGLVLLGGLATACDSDGGLVQDAGEQVSAVVHDVNYYGACGNETVDVAGVTYYPLFSEELADLDTTRYPTEIEQVEDQAPSGFRSAPAVEAPGPGDDIGTMIIYEDGIARYQSDSGTVIWLTAEEHTYNWEC